MRTIWANETRGAAAAPDLGRCGAAPDFGRCVVGLLFLTGVLSRFCPASSASMLPGFWRMTPHIIHNYATDLAINSMIPEEELPEGGLIPGKAFKELTEEDKAKMGAEAVARYERVSAKIESFEKGWASEVYFAKLMEDPEIAKDIQEGGGKGKGEAGEDGEGAPGLPGGMDDHEGWADDGEGGISEAEKELIRGKVKKAGPGRKKGRERNQYRTILLK